MILASLPLRVGYEATIVSIDEMISSDAPKPVSVRVLREETVPNLRHEPTKAFVIEYKAPDQPTTLFWISKAAPYYLRLEMDVPAQKMRFVFDQI